MAGLSNVEMQLVARLDVEANVTFVFRKSDFSLRVAHGTRNLQFVPMNQWPQQKEAPSNSVITYTGWLTN